VEDIAKEETLQTGIMNGYDSFVKPDVNSCVVLPITADISDVEIERKTKDLPDGVVGQLTYIYGGHVAGYVDIVLSNAEVFDNYFENQKPTNTNVIVIKSSTILIVLGCIVLLVLLILLIKFLYDNFYLILHNIQVKKQRRKRFRKTSRRKKKWRKKDRMFR
jgi:hypothetical protein